MVKHQSFTKYEQQIRPRFRQDINNAESTEDVKKFFAYSMKQLFTRAFAGKVSLEFGDIALTPGHESGYCISERLLGEIDFSSTWHNSDLSSIVKRLADPAVNRFYRLAKNPGKSEMKLFHTH